MAVIDVKNMGLKGVNVDKDPLELAPEELRQAQNAINNSNAALRKRPGLAQFNTTDNDGFVMGGTTVPLVDFTSGFSILYLGRGGPV